MADAEWFNTCRIEAISDLLHRPNAISRLSHDADSPSPSLLASPSTVQSRIEQNIALASNIVKLERDVYQMRTIVRNQLLTTHALERQWKQKETELDSALRHLSPSALYLRLQQGSLEQLRACSAIEQGFFSGRENDELEAPASEKVFQEQLNNYVAAKRLAYLRYERRNRWDEGRVGGWP
jgi:hypothetical protein